MFVKGQKVICVNDTSFSLLKKGGIYTVNQTEVGCVYIDHNSYPYPINKFRTIIQSLDDIVVGMELTHKQYGKVRIYGISEGRIASNYLEGVCVTLFSNTDDFIEYKPKEEIMSKEEYEVIKPFNIKDIWDAFKENHSCMTFLVKWRDFLEDFKMNENRSWCVSDRFISFSQECVTKTMWENRDWFEKKGLIKKIEKDVILVPGMKLMETDGGVWTIVDDQNKAYYLVGKENLIFNHRDVPWNIKGYDLSDLNFFYTFEVVSNGS